MATVVGVGVRMDTKQEAWSACIRELLKSHGLSIRGAALKAGTPSLRTYLADWCQGQIPQYRTAIAFLEHFPLEERIVCLRAGGFPIPSDWTEDMEPWAAVELNTRRLPGVTEADIKRIMQLVHEISERGKQEDIESNERKKEQ